MVYHSKFFNSLLENYPDLILKPTKASGFHDRGTGCAIDAGFSVLRQVNRYHVELEFREIRLEVDSDFGHRPE